MIKQDLIGAHVDEIWLANTQQQLFNSLMQAFSRPGRFTDWQPWIENNPVYLAVLATLLDNEVSLADVNGLLKDSDWPLLQSKKMSAEQANYVLCDASTSPSFSPNLGTLSSPDFASTLVLKVDALDDKIGTIKIRLRGPGVDGDIEFWVSGMSPEWLVQRNEWCSTFPLGVDLILVDDTRLLALPRSSDLTVMEVLAKEGAN